MRLIQTPMDLNRVPVSRNEKRMTPIICYSHLRWDFVFQRPQHLMSRFAQDRLVIFVQEPVTGSDGIFLETKLDEDHNVLVVTPHIAAALDEEARAAHLRALLQELVKEQGVSDPILWYYTPMMLHWSSNLRYSAVVYDCMDELANFRFAPSGIVQAEDALLARADVVFTGGHSLYEAKRHRHGNMHPFPSAVDIQHFGKARHALAEPADQARLPTPRLGFFGVIDERMDIKLLSQLAEARPDWSIVVLGPVVKIDPAELPRHPNLHFLGAKSYADLPQYLAGWDVALMPFAMNDSTRFISPTKTPEYLAGGKPVVSTPIADVVRCYGDIEGVYVAAGAEAFIAACESALALSKSGGAWLKPVDALLSGMSWNETHRQMDVLIEKVCASRCSADQYG